MKPEVWWHAFLFQVETLGPDCSWLSQGYLQQGDSTVRAQAASAQTLPHYAVRVGPHMRQAALASQRDQVKFCQVWRQIHLGE